MAFFSPQIPSMDQLTNFHAWDQTLGLTLALIIAFLVGAYIILTFLFSGFMGGRPDNCRWMMLNLVVGFALSLYTLAITGLWVAGCLVAILCFISLRAMREMLGG